MKSNLANSKRYPTWWCDSIHRWFWHWNLWLSIARLMAMSNFASAELLKNPRFYVPPLLLSVTFGLFTAWRNMITTHGVNPRHLTSPARSTCRRSCRLRCLRFFFSSRFCAFRRLEKRSIVAGFSWKSAIATSENIDFGNILLKQW